MKTNTLLFFLCMVFMPLVSANSSNVNNQKKNSKIKVPIYTSYNTQVSGGSTHSLIVKPNGELWGCGDNNHCELGFNIATISTEPIKIMDDVASASAGCYYSLVVKKDGTLWRSVEHETYYTSNKTIWEKVSDNVAAVAAAVKSFVYLKQDGSAWVSGRWITDDVVSIAAGWYHYFFIKSDGSLWASGLNVEGVLGLGNKFVGENISTPEKVTDNVAQVASCNTHTLILKKDGTLWTCGENKGLLGKNGVVRYPSPTKVTNNVKSIAVGNNHSLFVKYDGSLWATGSNEFGQLGINYGEYKELWNPKQIASNVVSIAAGYDHTLLALSDGSVWTCGNNKNGQLGIGFTKLQWDEITKIDKWEKCLPTDVTISPKSATIPVGGRLKLNYTVSPSNAIKNVTWRSDNNNVASCYEGTVNGYKKGVANIYIETANGIVDVCEVTVMEGSVDPTAITISPSSKTINVGESFQASYTLTPSNATTTVTWSSDDTNIATVSSSGVVKGIKAGSTYINVKTANGKTDYFKVTVKEVTVDPTAITISPSSKTINVGESFQASYTLTPSNATTTVTWSSDNTNIATVSSSGVVKGIKAGSTYINVKTANGKTDYFKVTVKESPKLQLSATPSGGEVEKGTIVKLVAKANGSTVSADIYYTTNGTTPTKSSTKYTSSGIVINSGCTIKAIAYKDGYETSDVLTAKYTIKEEPTPNYEVSQVEAGYYHSLILAKDGALWAWGCNRYGQLGNGTTIDRATPVKIMSDVKSMSAGSDHSLILKNDGTLWACGYNYHGQLGDGTTTNRKSYAKIMTGVKSMSAGNANSLILKNDGSLWACGGNWNGQLGDGTTTDKKTPIKVMTDVKSMSAGAYHSLILKNDGSLWACGYNKYGQLGDGTTTDRTTPVRVMTDVKSMSAGMCHSLIQKNDGSLWACGYNYHGELGDGTTTDRKLPVKVMADVKSMSAGVHSLIQKNDGTLWACGSNSRGQLGDGTTTNSTTPVKVMSGVKSISAGWVHSLILKNDGSLWACGNNEYGQLGDGTTTNRHTPVKIMDGVNSAGIDGVLMDRPTADNSVFSLSGQRLSAPRKGLNIIGGKKVMVK